MVLPWLVILHYKIYVLVLTAFLLPVRIYPAHLTYEFMLMSFLLHKVTFIHVTLAAVFQLQRSKADANLGAQSSDSLCCTHCLV